jgi:nucleoid DNA-binding protein
MSTKADLTDTVYHKMRLEGLTRKGAQKAVETIFHEMRSALGRHEKVIIRGLGEFSVVHKNERIGKNPQTCEDAVVTARDVVRFKVSEKWKREVNDGER